MASERQIAANRRNALRSTGPRTAQGKSIVKRNALRHGLSAQHMFLTGEDPKDFEQLGARLYEQFDPVGAVEEELVDNLAETLWRLRRAPVFEAAILDWNTHYMAQLVRHVRNPQRDRMYAISKEASVPDPLEVDPRREDILLGRALGATLSHGDLLTKLARHEGHLMRQLERILDQLRKLNKERPQARPTSTQNLEVSYDVGVALAPLVGHILNHFAERFRAPTITTGSLP